MMTYTGETNLLGDPLMCVELSRHKGGVWVVNKEREGWVNIGATMRAVYVSYGPHVLGPFHK